MIAVPLFAGRTVAVFGLARSGLSAARALLQGGARVVAWDDSEKSRAAASALGATLADPATWDWSAIAALILSPGIPLTHPAPHAVVVAARDANVEVIGDTELFVRVIKAGPNGNGRTAPLICITGTNGKSTTTALIGHIAARCGFDAQVGGNIGRPALDLSAPRENTLYVLEMSSYQLDLTPSLRPDVGVLLNISPDHLDRHGGMDGYVAAKKRLFARLGARDLAVIGVDDRHAAEVCTLVSSRAGGPTVAPVAIGQVVGRGVYVLDGTLYDGRCSPPVDILDIRTASALPGAHNWQNAAAAYAAIRPFVKDVKAIARAIAQFPGLPHRIETVGRIGRVRFVNDSKATNADATEKALACFDGGIHWIVGGKPKSDGIEPLRRYFPRIVKAYLIGEASDAFARTLEGAVTYEKCGTLDVAMRRAHADARTEGRADPAVLLSPACASFDQFRDFEHRGDAFRDLFKAMKAEASETVGA